MPLASGVGSFAGAIGLRGGRACLLTPRISASVTHSQVKGIKAKVLEELDKICNLTDRDAKHLYLQMCQLLEVHACEFVKIQHVDFKKERTYSRLLGVAEEQVIVIDDRTKKITSAFNLAELKRWDTIWLKERSRGRYVAVPEGRGTEGGPCGIGTAQGVGPSVVGCHGMVLSVALLLGAFFLVLCLGPGGRLTYLMGTLCTLCGLSRRRCGPPKAFFSRSRCHHPRRASRAEDGLGPDLEPD